ncbi:hypothetical protein [Sphingomonas astaxanthinifaciens]|nr:hypothetical protein [Sphingomonas astaxanthinifaciens]
MIPTIPLFVEAALLALAGYGLGLFIAFLAELHRRRQSRAWNEWE